MKRLSVFFAVLISAAALFSCGSDSSDSKGGISEESKAMVDGVNDVVTDAISNVLSMQSSANIFKVMNKDTEANSTEFDKYNSDKTVHITGTMSKMKITFTNYSAKSTDEGNTEHTVVLTGTVDNEMSSDETTHAETMHRVCNFTSITYDGGPHTMSSDTTTVSTMNEETKKRTNKTTGSITFDGATDPNFSNEEVEDEK